MTITGLLWLSLCRLACGQPSTGLTPRSLRLPAALIDGRFYLKIPTRGGDTLMGFCDTGGGFTAIYNPVIDRLGLRQQVRSSLIERDTLRYLLTSELYNLPHWPVPQVNPYYQRQITQSILEVAEDAESKQFFQRVPHDVFLGQFFFLPYAWTFDYRRGSLMIHTALAANPADPQQQRLGFKKDRKGNKRFGHPRMSIRIDGQTLEMLFDTGATLLLSPAGKAALGTSSASAGGSFIRRSLFLQWRQRHPDWRTVPAGELNGADLIEVPEVQVGNQTAGPVWFASRPDDVWTSMMTGTMDRAVQGAVGGSLLQYFTVQIDYNSEVIRFEK